MGSFQRRETEQFKDANSLAAVVPARLGGGPLCVFDEES